MAARARMVAIWGAILALGGCSPSPPPVAVRPGPEGTDPVPGPVGPALWKGGRSLRWQAETTIRVQAEGEEPRVIEDLRQMDRTAEGDYRVVVRRRVPLSAGDVAEESFTAISVGKALWTRGSGGPFVAWEDPAAAIREFEGIALQGSADLYRIASACGRARPEDGREHWVLEGGGCEVPPERGGGPGRVDRLDLVVERSGGEFRALSARVEWTVRTEGGPVAALLEHRARADDLPLGNAPKAPEEAVSARRERPVRMARQILSGLGEWAPGAPWRDQEPAAPGSP
ncbi:hypothetical protein KBD49_02115 [Myxococcota bacterium]|nr:hypothetical protein [Myxococcota bacterium]